MSAPATAYNSIPLYNFYETIRDNPVKHPQLTCHELLMTEFTCPLEGRKQALWSHQSYFIYVLEGKKIWHTPRGAFELTKNTCAFVRKGASIVEQFFDTEFCVLLFFISDEFICETLRPYAAKWKKSPDEYKPVIPIEVDVKLAAFMQSMLPHFTHSPRPDQALLELKFRELLLNVAGNSRNQEALSYFCSLLYEPASVSLRKIMEDNFSYNLKLEEYAQLCKRSLSAFKRDFQKTYGMPPGKWLLERRLAHAKLLLMNADMAVSEVAYESGFENLSHFSRVFRDQYDMPPIAFRQQTGL